MKNIKHEDLFSHRNGYCSCFTENLATKRAVDECHKLNALLFKQFLDMFTDVQSLKSFKNENEDLKDKNKIVNYIIRVDRYSTFCFGIIGGIPIGLIIASLFK